MSIRERLFPCQAETGPKASFFGLDFLQYVGPGFLITIGFIDPGNWAVNLVSGAEYGYALLWVVTLSTFMLIFLQRNAARLGIVSGRCLSEAAMHYIPTRVAFPVLISAVCAAVATAFAELLGAAIALRMLFGLPLLVGASLTALVIGVLLVSNSYRKIEMWLLGFVSLIGMAFIYELSLVDPDWQAAGKGWLSPEIPTGSLVMIIGILGAVVMPHNLFLHSEIIQSRQWHLADPVAMRRQLRYEFTDTVASMLVGWGVNSAMIILAACTFFLHNTSVVELEQAQALLVPLLSDNAATLFAVALLLAGFASSVTAAMASGSIVAGMSHEPYDSRDNHTRLGIGIALCVGVALIALISNPLDGLVLSQAALSLQLPASMGLLIWLTSSKVVMGDYANSLPLKLLLICLAGLVSVLNLLLLFSLLF